jgi:hypothetical protein
MREFMKQGYLLPRGDSPDVAQRRAEKAAPGLQPSPPVQRRSRELHEKCPASRIARARSAPRPSHGPIGSGGFTAGMVGGGVHSARR